MLSPWIKTPKDTFIQYHPPSKSTWTGCFIPCITHLCRHHSPNFIQYNCIVSNRRSLYTNFALLDVYIKLSLSLYSMVPFYTHCIHSMALLLCDVKHIMTSVLFSSFTLHSHASDDFVSIFMAKYPLDFVCVPFPLCCCCSSGNIVEFKRKFSSPQAQKNTVSDDPRVWKECDIPHQIR